LGKKKKKKKSHIVDMSIFKERKKEKHSFSRANSVLSGASGASSALGGQREKEKVTPAFLASVRG